MTDPSEWSVPTIEQIDAAREERGIRKTHFSMALGYSTNGGWGVAVDRGHCSLGRLRLAVEALTFFDEHGYIPVPDELDADVPCRQTA